MSRYTLQHAAILLSTGRTMFCQQLHELIMLDNLSPGALAHTRTDRHTVELKQYQHVSMGDTVAQDTRLIADRGLRYITIYLGEQIVTDSEAANDAIH